MPTHFSRTLRSLSADRGRAALGWLLVPAGFLAAWLAWFFWVPVPVYAVSEAARLEVEQRAHPVEAPVGGRVVESRLALGREVREGDLLVRLDSALEEIRATEEEARRAALVPQLEALARQLGAEKRVLADAGSAATAAAEGARARSREAESAAEMAETYARRQRTLFSGGAGTEAELQRAGGEAVKGREAASASGAEAQRVERDRRAEQGRTLARIAVLDERIASLQGELAASASTIATLRQEIARRSIRAPIAGRLDEVLTAIQPGSVAREGERLATVVPPGEVKLVAEFLPSAAIGRIRPGQPARLRLDGFPWTEFGSVAATVTSAGSEVRAGRVGVDLSVERDPASRIPLEHGLPGVVEVEVDRASAARLIVRAAGRLLAGTGGLPSPRTPLVPARAP